MWPTVPCGCFLFCRRRLYKKNTAAPRIMTPSATPIPMPICNSLDGEDVGSSLMAGGSVVIESLVLPVTSEVGAMVGVGFNGDECDELRLLVVIVTMTVFVLPFGEVVSRITIVLMTGPAVLVSTAVGGGTG